MAEPVISVRDAGIEFYRSRRRRMQLRELLFHGRSGAAFTPEGKWPSPPFAPRLPLRRYSPFTPMGETRWEAMLRPA